MDAMEALRATAGVQLHSRQVAAPGTMDLYRDASSVVDRVRAKKGTVKSLCLAAKYSDKKRLYAVVYGTLKYKDVLLSIITTSGLLKSERKIRESMALVLLHDHFVSKGGIQCGGDIKKRILKHKVRLQAELSRLLIKAKAKSITELVEDSDLESMPRFARVNTLKATVDEVTEHFSSSGHTLVDSGKWMELEAGTFCHDPHLSDLLVFPTKTDFHAEPMYLSGEIILQDKASCFPAHALRVSPGSWCIDACAAPGNKTSHLAAQLQNEGKVFAFDISAPRLKTMSRLHAKAGVTCTVVENKSFLDVNPNKTPFSEVKFILLDPSCSGSGIISRLNDIVDEQAAQDLEDQQQRLESLAKFQVECVLHAMKFPSVERLSYSTCSVHQEENENVVATVLEKNQNFQLCPALPQWPRRGLPVVPGAEHLVRCDPSEDCTNGFFVAVFERKSGVATPSAAIPKKKKKKKKAKKRKPGGDEQSETVKRLKAV